MGAICFRIVIVLEFSASLPSMGAPPREHEEKFDADNIRVLDLLLDQMSA